VEGKPQERPLTIEYGGEVFQVIRTESLRLDSVPDFDLYFRPGPDQPFVLYCERNTPFTKEARRRLAINRVDRLCIRREQRGVYDRYIAGHLREILADPRLSVKEKATILYDSAQAVVEDVLARPESRENVVRGKEIAYQTVEFMTTEDFPLEHLLRAISCDYYLYTHSVNVVAYSVALASRAGYRDKALLREIANGALLHDVGMSSISSGLLTKKGPLTAAEWNQLQTHPQKSFDLLQKAGCLGEIALDIALHHHEKRSGDGYPDRLAGDNISAFVRVVTIADVFDALTTDRFHKGGLGTFDALTVMLHEMKDELDPDLLRRFVEMLGHP
jgi:HD-GYP domain-containing protein (c-di-GMP phosphodiesterase class II)